MSTDPTPTAPALYTSAERVNETSETHTHTARTLMDWCEDRYAWEHFTIGMLFGFLLGAIL